MKQVLIIAALIFSGVGIGGCRQIVGPAGVQIKADIYVNNTAESGLHAQKEILKMVSAIRATACKNLISTKIEVRHPYHNALFPRDFAAPLFAWQDDSPESEIWMIQIGFESGKFFIYVLSDQSEWTPDRKIWEIIKENSLVGRANITIFGIDRRKLCQVTSQAKISIATSQDKVSAPILYQQMPLPISYAARHPEEFKWRLGDLSTYTKPRVVLEKQPVCGMCHHFSLNGKVFGMDLDVNGDKGAYGLSPVKKRMVFAKKNFLSWTAFQNDGEVTLGLFAKISPDGQYVVSTIKEKRIFFRIDDLAFSELFFPCKGVLACYSKKDDRFFLLPGAADPGYVHVAPTWSPDGKYIVFSRADVNEDFLYVMGKNQFVEAESDVRIEDLNKKFRIRYDLYRMPFNHGRGGKAEPLQGGSHNGKSNYWARYSPDGKWIVFTQSDNAMMNQPGSRLFILPAQGGKARRLQSSRNIHNSWHSWSPNSKWLVFTSKVNTPFTELFLTHIDENGNDSPPILLSRFNSKRLASVLPEFANISSDAVQRITVE